MPYIAKDFNKNYSELRVTASNVAAKRAAAIQKIFHQAALPTDQMVFVSDEGNGASTYSFTTKGTVPAWTSSWVYNIQRRDPTSGNTGKIFLYCQGHENDLTNVFSFSPYLRNLGYTVCWVHMPCISPNTGPYGDGDINNALSIYHPGLFATLGSDATQYFLYAMLSAVNFFEANGFSGKIMVAGHSGGCMAPKILAALDPRIKRSALFCGTAPSYLASQWNGATPDTHYRSDAEQAWPGIELSNMDWYTMGSVGAGRSQVHHFNQNDACCYRAAKLVAMDYKTPINALAVSAGGAFDVVGVNGAAQHYPMLGDSGITSVNNRILAELASL